MFLEHIIISYYKIVLQDRIIIRSYYIKYIFFKIYRPLVTPHTNTYCASSDNTTIHLLPNNCLGTQVFSILLN